VSDSAGLETARHILQRIYNEQPAHWPNGLTPDHFDGGLYLVREKRSNASCGFVGWQERWERDPSRKLCKVGYYSIGILPEYRGQHLAKAAVAQLISMKSAGVDRVKALIMADNTPSISLAQALGVEAQIKRAGLTGWLQ
jgi:RimJ/RimL family protein N-acetyltransferase